MYGAAAGSADFVLVLESVSLKKLITAAKAATSRKMRTIFFIVQDCLAMKSQIQIVFLEVFPDDLQACLPALGNYCLVSPGFQVLLPLLLILGG